MLVLSVLYCNFQTIMVHGFHRLLLFFMTMFVGATVTSLVHLHFESACGSKYYVTTLLSVEKYFTLNSITVSGKILSGKLVSWQT